MAQMKTSPPRDVSLGCTALPPALVSGHVSGPTGPHSGDLLVTLTFDLCCEGDV